MPTTEWTPLARERDQHEPAVVRGMAGLAALLVACILVAAGAYLVFVRTRWGQSVDQAVLQGRDVTNARTRHAAARILQTISVGSLGLGALGLAFIGVLRNRWRLALAVLTSVMGAVITTELLKHVILSRPSLVAEQLYPVNSLPSGHTTVATALAAGLVLVASHRYRAAAVIVGTLYAGGVGVSNVVLAAHRPSDIVAGYAVAVGWAAGVALLLALTHRTRPARPPTPTVESAVVLLLALGAAAMALLIVVAWVLRIEQDALGLVPFGRAFVLSILSLGAGAFGLLAALGIVLRPVTLDAHDG